MLACIAALAFVAAEPPPALWVVVTAPRLREAVRPLCQLRQAQGFRVEVVETDDRPDAARLREQVTALCRTCPGRSYVLLVGDLATVPALPGTISRMKDQPSDNGYGCPDDKLLPSVAVGRFPVRTTREAEVMVAKTMAYEGDDRPGEWRRQLTVLAGVPAYNPLVDRLVEALAVARFARLNPAWSGRCIYTNPASRFCVPDDDLHDRALDYVRQGQAFTLYLGHSNACGLWAGKARYLDRDDWAVLTSRHPGVFVTFGCNGCQLSGRDGEGYGVAAARNPGGPVAVLGSHGVCFAAMVQLAADGLFDSLFAAALPERLGDAWLRLKAGVAKGKIDGLTYTVLDAVDGDGSIPQATQRLEHLEMFVLLGDPALKLAVMPVDVKLSAEGDAAPGRALTVRGELPARLAGAEVRVMLERPASSQPLGLAPLPKAPPDDRARALRANHQRANRFVLLTKSVAAPARRFETTLELPADLPWDRVILRAYAVTGRHEGMGVLPLPLPVQ